MKKLLILGAGYLQIPIIKKAKSKNIYTIAVDMNHNAPGKKYVDEFYPIDTNDSLKLLVLAKEKKINGIITNSDYPMRTASLIATQLNLKGTSISSSVIATNKLILREILQESGVVGPEFAKISSVEDIFHFIKKIHFPFILKPVDSSASRGVNLIESEEQIEAAYNESIKHSKNGFMIMEEYIHGNEYSIESVTVNSITRIIAITEKITSGAPHFVELGHIVRANLDDKAQAEIEKLVIKAISAISISNGVCHTEIKMNSKGIFIIEIGPRLGGDYITTDLVPLATGYDMIGNAINIAMGVPLDSTIHTQKYVGISYFIAPEGELGEIIGIDILESTSQIHRYEFFIKPTDVVTTLKSSLDRAGYVIIVEDSYNKCMEKMQLLKDSVHFRMLSAEKDW